MNNTYFTEAKKALPQLETLKKTKQSRLEALEKYDGISLKSSTGKNKRYYYAKRKGEKEYRYLGGESNEIVIRVKESHFLHQLLKDVESEIQLLTDMKNKHKEISYTAISARLPVTYRSTNLTCSGNYSEAARKWKMEKEEEKARYPVKHPERLIMQDIEGTYMRSKSEVIIANLLIAYGIPFVYELPHVINGVPIYSDFTALSTIDYKTEIIIEHEGMMDKVFYQNIFLDKVNAYLSADYVPGKDVFFTFDDLHGGFDTSTVQDIIDTRLIPRTGKQKG